MSPADLKENYSELVALTKLYLLREHSPKEWKICEDDSFAFFKAQAQKQKKPQAPLQTPPQTIVSTPPRKLEAAPAEPAPKKETAPPPTEKKVEPEKPQKKSSLPSFELNPPKEHPTVDCNDVKQILKKLFPQLTLIPTPPDDREAKKMLLYKQTTFEIAILSFDTKTPPFLTHVANAISQEHSTAKVISAQRVEKEKKWNQLLSLPHLKLIIASDYGLYSYPELMQHYREVPKQAKAYLAKIPLLLLADLSLYLKEPKLKPALWRAICEQLRDD